MSKKFVLRAAAITAASALVFVGAANSASAHVTVSSPDAKPGGYSKLVFGVASVSDSAGTTQLQPHAVLRQRHTFRPSGSENTAASAVSDSI